MVPRSAARSPAEPRRDIPRTGNGTATDEFEKRRRDASTVGRLVCFRIISFARGVTFRFVVGEEFISTRPADVVAARRKKPLPSAAAHDRRLGATLRRRRIAVVSCRRRSLVRLSAVRDGVTRTCIQSANRITSAESRKPMIDGPNGTARLSVRVALDRGRLVFQYRNSPARRSVPKTADDGMRLSDFADRIAPTVISSQRLFFIPLSAESTTVFQLVERLVWSPSDS